MLQSRIGQACKTARAREVPVAVLVHLGAGGDQGVAADPLVEKLLLGAVFRL